MYVVCIAYIYCIMHYMHVRFVHVATVPHSVHIIIHVYNIQQMREGTCIIVLVCSVEHECVCVYTCTRLMHKYHTCTIHTLHKVRS